MRFVVLGAGAIGGGVGGLLFKEGHDVTLVARGKHGKALRRHGLTLATPADSQKLKIPTVLDVSEALFAAGDVVLLATKLQDADAALTALRRATSEPLTVVCLQNGLAGERMIARRGFRVVSAMVWVPATCLVPGEIRLHGSPGPGALDVGGWPLGADRHAAALAAPLTGAGFDVAVRPDVMAWKRAKLLTNICGVARAALSQGGRRPVYEALMAEGHAVFEAGGLSVVSQNLLRDRIVNLSEAPVNGVTRDGGPVWQSLSTGRPSEVDYLCGELMALGRELGVPTPVNDALAAAVHRMPPGTTRTIPAHRLLA